MPPFNNCLRIIPKHICSETFIEALWKDYLTAYQIDFHCKNTSKLHRLTPRIIKLPLALKKFIQTWFTCMYLRLVYWKRMIRANSTKAAWKSSFKRIGNMFVLRSLPKNYKFLRIITNFIFNNNNLIWIISAQKWLSKLQQELNSFIWAVWITAELSSLIQVTTSNWAQTFKPKTAISPQPLVILVHGKVERDWAKAVKNFKVKRKRHTSRPILANQLLPMLTKYALYATKSSCVCANYRSCYCSLLFFY